MARNSLLCADVPLRNYSLTHSLSQPAQFVNKHCVVQLSYNASHV